MPCPYKFEPYAAIHEESNVCPTKKKVIGGGDLKTASTVNGPVQSILDELQCIYQLPPCDVFDDVCEVWISPPPARDITYFSSTDLSSFTPLACVPEHMAQTLVRQLLAGVRLLIECRQGSRLLSQVKLSISTDPPRIRCSIDRITHISAEAKQACDVPPPHLPPEILTADVPTDKMYGILHPPCFVKLRSQVNGIDEGTCGVLVALPINSLLEPPRFAWSNMCIYSERFSLVTLFARWRCVNPFICFENRFYHANLVDLC